MVSGRSVDPSSRFLSSFAPLIFQQRFMGDCPVFWFFRWWSVSFSLRSRLSLLYVEYFDMHFLGLIKKPFFFLKKKPLVLRSRRRVWVAPGALPSSDDRRYGCFFLKFCSYASFPPKMCINLWFLDNYCKELRELCSKLFLVMSLMELVGGTLENALK